MQLLGEHRPGDAVLSEEGKDDKRPARRARPGLDRRPARRHPGVLRAAPRRLGGARRPVGSDIRRRRAGGRCGGLPALGTTFHTGRPPVVPPSTASRPRLVVSRTRPPAFVKALAEEIDAELVPMGSAGAKAMSVVRDVSDAYVHAGGQYEWDSAAPVAVARAAGLFTSRVDGSPSSTTRTTCCSRTWSSAVPSSPSRSSTSSGARHRLRLGQLSRHRARERGLMLSLGLALPPPEAYSGVRPAADDPASTSLVDGPCRRFSVTGQAVATPAARSVNAWSIVCAPRLASSV